MAMEFWGVEVKRGESLKVDPGENTILHISQVALGEGKNDKGNERILLYMNVYDQKFVLGTLSHEKFPHFSTEILVEKAFELSHTWKNGSVYVSGYKVDEEDSEANDFSEDEPPLDNGKLEPNINQAKADAAKSTTSTKHVNFVEPSRVAKTKQEKDDDNDEDKEEDMSSSEESDDDKGQVVSDEDDSEESSDDQDDKDNDDSDEDGSSDDETPEKPESSKKRPVEAANQKSSASNKKAKFVTPQKTDGTKSSSSVHIATPHPAKQAGKKPSNVTVESSKQQTLKSGGGPILCKSCNRSFTTEVGLQSHTKAKHRAAA